MTPLHRLTKRQAIAAVLAPVVVALLGSAAPTWSHAQSASTLRLIVPYPPGGGTDRAARLVAEALQQRIGQTVIVENMVGVGGRLAMRQMAAAPADTNALVLVNPALMVVAPMVYKNNGYDPDKDFQPVSVISTYEMAVAVGPAVPVREFNHMLAWLRVNPEKASIGVPATGSLPHFFALMMADAAKAKVEVIGYKGSAPLSTDVIGGHIPVAIDAFESLVTQHEGGKVRILATSGAKRALPGIPTLKESGLDVVAEGWNAIVAKVGMPAAQVDRLAKEISAIMKTPEMQQKFAAMKAVPASLDRAQSVAMIQQFKKAWVPTIEKANLKFD